MTSENDELDDATLGGRLDAVIGGLTAVHTSIDEERDARLKDAAIRDKENVSRDRRSGRILLFSVIAAIIGVIGIAAGVAGLVYGKNAQATADDILATRSSSRIGLCNAINDMRGKHNHLVNTNIIERERIIQETLINPSVPQDRKDASVLFFRAQIEEYKGDLLAVIDCTDPDSLGALFSG